MRQRSKRGRRRRHSKGAHRCPAESVDPESRCRCPSNDEVQLRPDSCRGVSGPRLPRSGAAAGAPRRYARKRGRHAISWREQLAASCKLVLCGVNHRCRTLVATRTSPGGTSPTAGRVRLASPGDPRCRSRRDAHGGACLQTATTPDVVGLGTHRSAPGAQRRRSDDVTERIAIMQLSVRTTIKMSCGPTIVETPAG
jgi:hypothetical protein